MDARVQRPLVWLPLWKLKTSLERDKDAEKNDKKSGQCSKPVETAEIARIGGITGIKEAC